MVSRLNEIRRLTSKRDQDAIQTQSRRDQSVIWSVAF